MRAVGCWTYGGPDVLEVVELPDPEHAAGPGATVAVGTPVAAMTKFIGTGRGGHAELVVVDERSAVPLPDGFDLVRAATLPMNGLTARMALDVLGLDPGAWLGVTGAAG